MSTLPLRAQHVPQISLRPGVMRVLSAIATVLDVFIEAQDMARDAHKRYPFAEG